MSFNEIQLRILVGRHTFVYRTNTKPMAPAPIKNAPAPPLETRLAAEIMPVDISAPVSPVAPPVVPNIPSLPFYRACGACSDSAPVVNVRARVAREAETEAVLMAPRRHSLRQKFQ
jgi:hypothetical protein